MASGTTMQVCYKPNWYIGVQLNKVPGEERTVMATWSCNWTYVAKYEVFWRYGLQNGKYFDSVSNVTHIAMNNTYQNKFTYPENATWVQVWVRPHEANEDPKTSKWKYLCPWSPGKDGVWFYVYDYATPKDIPTPTIENDKYKITVTASTDSIDYDSNTKQVQFYIVDGDGNIITRPYVNVNNASAIARYTFNGTAGKKYKACARGYNNVVKVYGKWSSYSSEVEMPPVGISISNLYSLTPTSVRMTWPSAKTAKSYIVNYTSTQSEFQQESAGSTLTFTGTTGDIEGLESGKTWYFRIKTANDSGESGWSAVKSVLLGIKPSPPTTWSNTVTAKIGEKLTLNWTHNTRDGSGMQESQVEININGSTKTYTVAGKKDSDTKEWVNTGSYDVDTSKITDGSTIRWRVRTRGVLATYSDWSVTREVKVYAPATLTVVPYKTQTPSGSALTNLDSFPFYIIATAGPSTQKAIGFYISIVANNAYQKVDYNGETVWVGQNEEVYSHYFDFDSSQTKVEFEDYAVIQNNTLTLKLMPYDVDFESGQSYTIKGIAAMSTGLTAEAYSPIDVYWVDQELYPTADVQVDTEDFTATIIPSCPVIPDSPEGMVEFEEEEGPEAELPLVEDVLLSVYRREYDGRMTKILDGIDNDRSTAVVDPHPSIDYARYRVVAIDQTTGAVGYTDLESVPIGQPGIVIQWDEEWKDRLFVNPADNEIEGVAGWSGTRLTLPFNVKTSEGNKPDRALVEYVGQAHPTSYFGTQLGTTATWSTVIEKSDADRLDLVRRLSAYQGNVYVRNSRGVGYWATVELNYNIDYGDSGDSLLIPITINVTRVRGGI